ncbi:MAG: hypothetical protein C0475_03640 [Planctomyces sp.]|nr:hypothetical protein [Planctomyces sp.]
MLVEMVMAPPTPSDAASAMTPGTSPRSSGNVRWQCVSITGNNIAASGATAALAACTRLHTPHAGHVGSRAAQGAITMAHTTSAGDRSGLWRAIRLLAVALAVALSAPLARAGLAAQDASERWYVVRIAGNRAGHMRQYERVGPERIESGTEMVLKIDRGAQTLEIKLAGRFVETPDGRPIEMVSEQSLGGAGPAVIARTVFAGDTLETTTTTGGGAPSLSKAPWKPDGDWQTPYAAGKRLEASFGELVALGEEAIGQAVTTRTLDPLVGLRLFNATFTIRGTEDAELEGRTVPAVRVDSTADVAPGYVGDDLLDHSGKLLRSSLVLGGLKVEVFSADRQLALSPAEPAELLESTLIRPTGGRVPRAGEPQAVYKLRMRQGAAPELLGTPRQRVERLDERTLRVSVDGRAAVAPAPGEDRDAALTGPSAMIDTRDNAVAQFARAALGKLGPGATPDRTARALERAVHEHIVKKDFGVGFASASEVVRTRHGDCTEHGVLLAAALRSAGIPARVVTGLVGLRADPAGRGLAGDGDIFGYHMWTQALIPGPTGALGWVDLDAALPDGWGVDHIAISVSALADGQLVNSFIELAPLFAGLEIEILTPAR